MSQWLDGSYLCSRSLSLSRTGLCMVYSLAHICALGAEQRHLGGVSQVSFSHACGNQIEASATKGVLARDERG